MQLSNWIDALKKTSLYFEGNPKTFSKMTYLRDI